MKAGDLFCGLGGWSEALRQLGIETVWGVDIWNRAIQAYRMNFDHRAIRRDIMKLDFKKLEPVDILVGSPPCPAFSSAKQWQPKDIQHGLRLVTRFFEAVRILKPKFYAMENVITFKSFVKHIKNLPKDAYVLPMMGTDFDMAQRRHRCIISNIVPTPRPEPSEHVLRDIIMRFDKPRVNDQLHRLDEVWTEHIGVLYTKKRLKEGAGRVPFPDPLDEPARTIVAKPSPIGREPIVIEDPRFRPWKLRYLTIREQAALQGFPDNYKLPPSNFADAQVLVGNAFPPPMAKALLEGVYK